jgi:hypothetical protein
MPDFDPDYPVSFAQGRNGQVYVFGGHGYRGRAYSPSLDAWREVGVDPPSPDPANNPAGKPTVEPSGEAYYIARIDITNNGSNYDTPPTVSIENTAGAGGHAASAITRLREGGVSAIEMTNYGKGYPVPTVIPDVTLSEPEAGTNATATCSIAAKAVVSVTINASGTRYTAPPRVSFLGGGGSGASAEARIEEGKVVELTLLSNGYGYTSSPVVSIEAQQSVLAEAFPVYRAHLRGKYQCYYRYVNEDIPESEGGPLFSNLSPVAEVDCGDGAKQIDWSDLDASGLGFHIELWRTTSNQATTLFRVAKLSGDDAFGSTTDDLTDWEVMDPGREGFQAMPVLLPNGELNANRFGVPPDNYSVAVMFQDRLWLAGDTGTENANTIRYSEVDEPESMPDVNELLLQSNLRASDYITALIPYAGALIVAQSRHCHRLTYVAQPLIDASVFLLAYRGVLNQRCWDIFDGRIYAMDDQGVYSMDPQGNVESLTLGLYDIWQEKIDYSLSKWFTVRVDKRNALLRVCVALKEDGSETFPSRMYVYSFDFKTWWEERYPHELTCATEVRLGDDRNAMALVYGTSTGAYVTLGVGETDIAAGSIHTITITNPGRGYRKPPEITASGGHGATFECGLDSDGRITGIVVKTPGTGYSAGALTIGSAPTGGTTAAATYTVITGEGQPVYWSFRSGAMEFVTDSTDKRGGETQTRHCSVVYKPTPSETILSLKTYYNNAAYPRSNVARRDRGTGFVHSDTVPAAVLNMQATPSQEAEASGVARALFAGNVLDDMTGNDRHVAIALSGQQDTGNKVVIHSLDVFGVNEQG